MIYAFEVVTAESTYPVTTAEAKTYLGISHSDHDAMIGDLIAAASKLGEAYTWILFGQRSLRMHFDRFQEEVIIPRTPISAIVSVKYYDTTNTLQTMSTDDYHADLISWPARIWFKNIPSLYDRPNAVQINMTAGHSDVATVEKGLKQAVLMTVVDMYDQRGTMVHGSSSMADLNYEKLFMAFRQNYHF